MKITKMLLITISCVSLGACASFQGEDNTQLQQQQTTQDQKIASALAEAAGSVSDSLGRLAANQQAANPPQSVNTPPAPATYGMQMPISLDWSGPIGPLVKKVAQIANYKVKVIGNVPPIPVIVEIHAENVPLAHVLQNAGLQAGNQASVVVYPTTKTVELRYNDDNNT